MSGRGIVLIILLLAGAGCSNKNSVPRDILPEDKMEQVMWDMAQADQYAALYLAKDSAHIDRKAETMRLYAEVFRLHQVTPEEFRKSYRYYLDHPELNQVLFDSVIARGYRARSEAYERPSSQYHPPVQSVKPGGQGGARPGGFMPGAVRPGGVVPGAVRAGGVVPGAVRAGAFPPVLPGARVQPGSGQAGMIQRMRETAARRDSILRVQAMHAKRDTTRRPAANGRP